MNRIAEASGSLACRQSYYLFCNGVQVLKHTTAVQETEMWIRSVTNVSHSDFRALSSICNMHHVKHDAQWII